MAIEEPYVPWHEEEFEREVRSALQRVEAPDGFTERVLSRAAVHDAVMPARSAIDTANTKTPPRRGVLLQFSRPVWRMAYAVAALLAITAGSIGVERHHAEQRRVDAAAAQFDEAMQVTGHALDRVSAQLDRSGFGDVQRALEGNGGK